MTRADALDVAVILLQADGGCSDCYLHLFGQAALRWPQIDWLALAKEASHLDQLKGGLGLSVSDQDFLESLKDARDEQFTEAISEPTYRPRKGRRLMEPEITSFGVCKVCGNGSQNGNLLEVHYHELVRDQNEFGVSFRRWLEVKCGRCDYPWVIDLPEEVRGDKERYEAAAKYPPSGCDPRDRKHDEPALSPEPARSIPR